MMIGGNALLRLSLIGALLCAGGCTGADEAGSAHPALQASTAASSPTADVVREELLQALQRSQRASFRYTLRGSLPEDASVKAKGAFDPVARKFKGTIKMTGGEQVPAIQRIVIGRHHYSQEPGQNTWMHLDLKRLKKDHLLYFDMDDPTGLVKFSSAVWTVRKTGSHTYEGGFDPNSGGKTFVPLGAPSIYSIGNVLAQYMVTTDDGGWVTSTTITLKPAGGTALSMTTEMSDHGIKLEINAPPKSQVLEAADFVYGK